MNIEEMVDNALSKLDQMSVDELEAVFVKAGYKPLRKTEVTRTSRVSLGSFAADGRITYCRSVPVEGKNSPSFSARFIGDDSFPTAA